jgi:hypothetical protein
MFSQKENIHVEPLSFDNNGVISKSMFNEELMSDPEIVQEMDEVYEKVMENIDFDLARHMLEKSYNSGFIKDQSKAIKMYTDAPQRDSNVLDKPVDLERIFIKDDNAPPT